MSGDRNPVHLDEEYAARSPFGQRIAHGFLVGSLISAAIGMGLPGPGRIYLGQTLKFVAPVHIGDTVTVSVEVIKVREDKGILTLRTDCTNQEGNVVLTGKPLSNMWAKLESANQIRGRKKSIEETGMVTIIPECSPAWLRVRPPRDVLTIGQYLRPSFGHLPIERYVPLEEFAVSLTAIYSQ